MDIEEEITVAYLLISRMRKKERKERKKKASKQVSWENFSKKRRERCFCTFSLFQLVLLLLGYNICWFFPRLLQKMFCFFKNQKNYLSLALMVLSKNDAMET